MDHQSINDYTARQYDLADLYLLRQAIFDAINNGAQMPRHPSDRPTPIYDGVDYAMPTVHEWQWPHDDAADLITAWQQATVS